MNVTTVLWLLQRFISLSLHKVHGIDTYSADKTLRAPIQKLVCNSRLTSLHLSKMLRGFLVIFLSAWRVEMVFTARTQCPEEASRVDEIQGNIQPPRWPQTVSHKAVYSDPLCLSKDFHVIQRECADSWLPQVAPECTYVSPRKPKLYCPPGYTVVSSKNEYVCLTVSKDKWSDICRFSPKAFDDVNEDLLIAIFKHLRERGTNTTWLPIKRLDDFGPLLWTIPGPLWSSRFDVSDELDIIYGDKSKKCLVLDVSQGFRIKAEACTANHPHLCVVEKNYFVRGACPSKYFASPIPGDERCFRLRTSDNHINWQNATTKCSTAKIDSPLIEQLFSGLARKTDLKETDYCWIGGIGKYRSNTLAMTVAGELTNFNTTTNLNCVFCQINTPTHSTTSISLKFYPNEGQLLLSVYGEEGLWKLSSSDPGIRCFTNANGDLIRNAKLEKVWDKRWTEKDIEPDIDFEDRVYLDVDIHKTIYRVKVSSKGPGYYVCEAHTISGELLTTKRVIAYKELEGNIFALGLEVLNACHSIEKCDPTFLKIYKKLAKDLEAATIEHLIEDIRTMQILDITPDGNIVVLFHVTAKKLHDEKFDPDSVTNAFMRSKRLFQLLAAVNPTTYKFLFLNSCDGCLSSVTGKEKDRLVWPYTQVGITAVSEEICLDSRGLPVYRICKGNFMQGGAWSEPSGKCASEILPSTKKLYSICRNIHESKAEYTRELANEVLSIVENTEQLSGADIYFLSKIIDYEAKTHKATEMLIEDLSRISFILDKVMDTDAKVLKQLQILNSTDILLDSLSTLLDFASMNISTEYLSEYDGLISIARSHLVIYILDPNITTISGLALIQNSWNSTIEPSSFLDYSVVPLTANHTIDDVAELGDVEVATWLPRKLLDVIVMSNGTNFNTSSENTTINYEAPRIVVTLFYNDLVFSSELVGQNNNEVSSRVISVSVPGYGVNLPFPIPLLFKPLKGTTLQNETCAFWDFDYVGISTAASLSAWSEDGCQNSGRTRDLSGELNVCLCSHLTHFAQLVLGHFPGPEEVGNSMSIQHGEALEVITVIGCVLSMVGVFGILITATVFRTWRKKPGSKVLIQLSLALGLEKFMIGILPMVDSVTSPIPCIITGAVFHYSILAEFSWMLITAWLQFKRYVTVLGATRPPRFLLKAAAFAWGVPLIFVTIVVAINPYIYMPEPNSGINYCQVSGIAQYAGLLAPVVLVICLNMCLYVRVIHSILGTRRKGSRVEDDKGLIIAQLRLGIMLFFLLGITWVFGLVARMGGGLLFSYLFCITAALQGFVLFMFFIICDPATRNLWYSLFKLRGKFSNSVSPSTSASSGISESTQRY